MEQTQSAMILEPQKIKSDTVSTVSTSISHEVMGLRLQQKERGKNHCLDQQTDLQSMYLV